jgi:Putative MetA-pathway of phenol degradation
MRTRLLGIRISCAVLALCACLLPAARAEAQGDGPHNLPLIPIGTNIFTPQVLVLSGNFNPQGTVLVPGAEIDVIAAPITYIRTFGLGSRFGRLFLVAPISSVEASVAVLDPIAGRLRTPERQRTGFMDPMVTMHIGLVGAPALKLPEFMKHKKSFQMVAILGTSIPVGTYDSDRLINLGTNRWSFRTGIGTVFPFGSRTALEMSNNLYFFTDNTDVTGPSDERSQAPLYVLENHLTHNFTPKVWGSLEARYQYGGTTTTDDRDDDNLTNALGGGASLGYQFTPHFGSWVSYGQVLAKKGDAEQTMFRFQIAYSF